MSEPGTLAEAALGLLSLSGTGNIYKIYAEGFRDERHLQVIVSEAQQTVDNPLAAA